MQEELERMLEKHGLETILDELTYLLDGLVVEDLGTDREEAIHAIAREHLLEVQSKIMGLE